jgi:hypothetical protein
MQQEEGFIYSLDTINNGVLLQKRQVNTTLSVWTLVNLPYTNSNYLSPKLFLAQWEKLNLTEKKINSMKLGDFKCTLDGVQGSNL